MSYSAQAPTRQQLAAELANDPSSVGYAALLAEKNWNGVADALNEQGKAANVTRREVALHELSEAVVYSEFIGRAFISGIFGAGSQTRANLTALLTRSASRAESLWGDGVVITDTMVEAAARAK